MYDIVFITDKPYYYQLDKLKKRFPLVKKATSYEDACKKSTTSAFWLVWPDQEVLDTFDFNFKMLPEDRELVHVFKQDDEFKGVCLTSKLVKVSEREVKHRFFLNRKQLDIPSTTRSLYDIIFISYEEPNAEENWQNLLKRYPRAKRVHGVKGIHQAHKEAARISDTAMFWVVDGDSVVVDSFDFELLLPKYDEDIVHVWSSSNSVNQLEYGYGGIKLLPKKETLDVDVTSTDMTTSISNKFRAVPVVSNITSFNTDPFNTWKSAFRECVKLASKSIQGQVDTETEERLDIWCTVANGNYGDYAILGALAGRKYGQENAGNLPALALINNFEWLKSLFQQTQRP